MMLRICLAQRDAISKAMPGHLGKQPLQLDPAPDQPAKGAPSYE